MPNKYPISQYYQPFNLTFTITEWHKHVTALSTHKKWMIKITDQAVYKEGGWEWVRGKKKKKKLWIANLFPTKNKEADQCFWKHYQVHYQIFIMYHVR